MEGKERILNYLTELLSGKKVLFIENDVDLYHGLDVIEEFFIDNKIKYHTLFKAGTMHVPSILNIVDFSDVIVWRSTYISELSHQLIELINNYPNKVFIEFYGNEPKWYYKNDLLPDVYTINVFLDDSFDYAWKLNKLSEKPLWEKADDEV